MKDSTSVNAPGFDLKSSYNTSKRRQIATTSSVAVSSSSSRKANGVAMYRNIHSYTDCNRVNIGISEIILRMKDATRLSTSASADPRTEQLMHVESVINQRLPVGVE
ncbi:hypothetical protein TNCV_1360721 [Trichonephila clavipes]|nr:hypothetical protein TNCV_1360721 [Trichonephila clavipes]